jgi:hypothetical protein
MMAALYVVSFVKEASVTSYTSLFDVGLCDETFTACLRVLVFKTKPGSFG